MRDPRALVTQIKAKILLAVTGVVNGSTTSVLYSALRCILVPAHWDRLTRFKILVSAIYVLILALSD